MRGSKIEGLLNEVDSAFQDLTNALEKMAYFENRPTYAGELAKVVEILMSVQDWILYRRKALQDERDQAADQILEKELSLYEDRDRQINQPRGQKRNFFKDIF